MFSRILPACRPASWILLRVAAALLLVVSICTWGQATTSVRGTVVDHSGKAVVGANVVLANSESKTERTATTGEQGEYQFLFVPPGKYTLSATAPGFRWYEQTDLQLLVNTPATANVQLTIGGTSETVTVSSEAPAINLVDASIGNSFDEVQVSSSPLRAATSPTCSACRQEWPTRVIVSATRIRILVTERCRGPALAAIHAEGKTAGPASQAGKLPAADKASDNVFCA